VLNVTGDNEADELSAALGGGGVGSAGRGSDKSASTKIGDFDPQTLQTLLRADLSPC